MELILKSDKFKSLSKEQVIDIIRDYIKEQLDSSYRTMISETTFENPSWSHQTAYNLGIQKLATKIIKFLPDQGK